MNKFSSKKGALAYLALLLPSLVVLGLLIMNAVDRNWTAVICLGIVIVTPLWMLFSTSYKLQDETLFIKSGPIRWKISVREIERVRRTRNPLASPALSIDRLEIIHRKGTIMISPNQEREFLSQLLKMNPSVSIEVKDIV